MTAGTYSLLFRQGDTKLFKVERRDSAGVAIDFTGYAWKMWIKRDLKEDTETAAEFTSSGGEISFVTPRVIVTMSAAKTDLLSGRYVYDIRGVSPAGDVVTPIQGDVFVTPKVTEL